MRLLLLNHNVAGTGTFQRASNLARQFAARGHDVTLVTTSRTARVRGEWRELGGARLFEAPDLWSGQARTGWDPWNCAHRIGALGGKFDLVHAFDCRPVVIYPALAVRRGCGARLVLDWADWWGRGGAIQERSGWAVRTLFGPMETWFEERFRLEADATTVISSALRERALRLGVDPQRVLQVPNGCALEDLRPVPVERARARLGIPASARLLLHLGTLTTGDMDLLVRAFRLLSRDLPDARLAFAGERRAAIPPDLLARGSAVSLGYLEREQLELWLGAANACVAAMRDTVGNRGRWPGKVNEYMSAGRPTVMTRVGDAAGVVEEEEIGWVVEPDPESLSRALLAALSDAPEAQRRGESARAAAESRLPWSAMAERVEELYVRVLRGEAPVATSEDRSRWGDARLRLAGNAEGG